MKETFFRLGSSILNLSFALSIIWSGLDWTSPVYIINLAAGNLKNHYKLETKIFWKARKNEPFLDGTDSAPQDTFATTSGITVWMKKSYDKLVWISNTTFSDFEFDVQKDENKDNCYGT